MDIVLNLIMVLVPMILSLSVHEFAHAWSAFRLGDDTAKRHGRLTLNPIAHIDPIGTLLLPALLTINGGGFFFGWAKPVPVNRLNFHRGITMKKGDILTAVAGPVSNLIMAFIFAGALVITHGLIEKGSNKEIFFDLFQRMFSINVALAVFNMLPIPPLDGHYLLPDPIQTKLQQHQMIVFIALIVAINVFKDILAVPIFALMNIMIDIWTFSLGGIIG